MSGQLQGASPWTRGAIRRIGIQYPDTLAQLEASIPDGARVVLTCSRRYGQWGAVLLREAEVARTSPDHRSLIEAVGAVVWEATHA